MVVDIFRIVNDFCFGLLKVLFAGPTMDIYGIFFFKDFYIGLS